MKPLLFTPLSLALAGAGVLLLYFFPGPVVFVTYNAALLALVLLDFFLLPAARDFRACRVMDEIISLGEAAAVVIEIRLQGGKRLPEGRRGPRLIGKDEVPPGLEAHPRELRFSGGGAGCCRAEYRLVPERRGDFRFGRLNLRCHGRLNLAARQYAFSPENDLVKVYPALRLFTRNKLYAFSSSPRQPGTRASRQVSLGTEFESLREYVPDDDYRQINWKASARSGALICNQYQVERSQNLLLVFEAGRMMLTETGGLSKLDRALNAGLLLGYAALAAGDRAGAMAFAEAVTAYLPPEARQGQIRKIARVVYRLQPRPVEPAYESAFLYLANRQKKRSLVCVFTDLVDSRASSGLIESALALSKKHLLLLVVLGDGFLAETVAGEIRRPEEIYRKAVAEQYLLEREQGMSYLRNRGVEVAELQPGADPAVLVSRYLAIKNRL